MDTKETEVEFIKSFKETVTSIDIENGDARAIEEYNDKIDEVIKLLQRGEKYEQILKEFIKKWGEYRIISPKERSYTSPKICWTLEKIEQKYFPKGGS